MIDGKTRESWIDYIIGWSERRGNRTEGYGQKQPRDPICSYTVASHVYLEREQGVPKIAPGVLIKDQVPVLALQPLLAVPVITNVVEDAIAVMVTLKL